MVQLADDRYLVISSDGHAGADILAYRDYLEARYLDDFDAWAPSYVNPFADLRGADADRNWDSARRLAELEDDGVVAEVLFPNTVPPFFPGATWWPGRRPPTSSSCAGPDSGRTTGGWSTSAPRRRAVGPGWRRSS